MKSPSTFFPIQALVLGYILCFALGNTFFKKAGDQGGNFRFWFLFFFLGNVICFVSTFFETWALANRNPNVIFAMLMGGGFCALQLVSYFIFRSPVSLFQWFGVVLIGMGIVLLQIK